jgi:hypothetical protein
MAEMQFIGVAMDRNAEGRPLNVVVIDPGSKDLSFKQRYNRVFRGVEFISERHKSLDWSSLA